MTFDEIIHHKFQRDKNYANEEWVQMCQEYREVLECGLLLLGAHIVDNDLAEPTRDATLISHSFNGNDPYVVSISAIHEWLLTIGYMKGKEDGDFNITVESEALTWI